MKGAVRVVAVSDLHADGAAARALVAASRGADLVVGAGDFCNQRHGLAAAMAPLEVIEGPFVAVPGNAESAAELRAAAPWAHVLHGSACTMAGLRIAGLGYAVPPTPFGAWSCDLDEATAAAMLDDIAAADLLITHSPPRGIADTSSTGQSVGSRAIHAAIGRLAPALAVCGHVHDSWRCGGWIGATRVVNLGPVPSVFGMEAA